MDPKIKPMNQSVHGLTSLQVYVSLLIVIETISLLVLETVIDHIVVLNLLCYALGELLSFCNNFVLNFSSVLQVEIVS